MGTHIIEIKSNVIDKIKNLGPDSNGLCFQPTFFVFIVSTTITNCFIVWNFCVT